MKRISQRLANEEEGSGLVFFLITFPIITVIFGLVVDTLLLSYARTSVQSAADSAAVVLASTIESTKFQDKYIDVYRNNLEHAKSVLECKKSTCGLNIAHTPVSSATRRVCVTVSEKVNFLFLDTLPFGVFGNGGDSLKQAVSNFADIKIEDPGSSLNPDRTNASKDYSCAIIK